MKKILVLLLFLFASDCFSQYTHEPPFRAEIRTHTLTDGLVGVWLINGLLGVTAFDLSRGGHDGTLELMDPLTDWIVGKGGTGLDFDGTNDRINISSIAEDAVENWTVFAICEPDANSLTGTILGMGTSGESVATNINFLLSLNAGVPRIFYEQGSGANVSRLYLHQMLEFHLY